MHSLFHLHHRNPHRAKDNFTVLTTRPVRRLILTLAVPTIISMLVTSFYNMADTYFVGKINTQSTASVGIVFSVMSIIQAIGFFFGHGSGNFISRKLGAREADAAGRMAATGFFFAFGAGVLLAVVGLAFLTPLSVALGSTPTILPYTERYLGIILLGAPFMTASLVLNNQIRFQGNALYGMVGIVSGAVINVGLDPLFIFTFGMGVTGAALATVLSQLCSFVLLLLMCRRGGNIPIRASNFTPSWAFVREIISGGTPSLMRQGLASLSTILLNVAAGVYGDAAIAGMSIVSRIGMFTNSFLIGFGQGFQPVCSYNWGAGLYGRVRQAVLFTAAVGTVLMALLSSLAIITAPALIGAFTDDPLVLETGIKALRAQCVVLFLSGVSVTTNMSTQGTGRYGVATLLALARQGLFFIPIVLLLPRIMGLDGVIYAQGAADILTFCLSLPFLVHFLKDLKQRMLSVKRA